MGSGKSYWGQPLADRMGMPFTDLDLAIEQVQGQSIAAIFEAKGEDFFRLLERQALERLVAESPSMVIACGGGTPCFFDNVAFMKQHGLVVWLDAPIAEIVRRLLPEKAKRPLIRNIPDDRLADFIRSKLNERNPFYLQADVRIGEGSFTLDKIIQQIENAK
jgi:shikimate kinase